LTPRIWNLSEIMKVFKSREFGLMLEECSQHSDECKQGKEATALGSGVPTDYQSEKIIQWFRDAEQTCTDVGMENASAKLNLIIQHFESNPKDAKNWSCLAADLRNAHDMIWHDIWQRKFIQVPAEYSEFVNNDLLFGLEVLTAFQEAKADIQQAGNCLATDSGTAAVFHLMRVVEMGLLALCEHLHITRVRRSKKPGKKKYTTITYSQWEKMLGAVHVKVDAKIDRLPPGKRKQDLQEFYYPLLQDLKGFKDAWRNHVMHGRREYPVPEAKIVFEHVKRFMVVLSTRLSQASVRKELDYLAGI
jgi:hypothetical protein